MTDIKVAVREAYSKASDNPEEKHPFPIGRIFAENVGYPAELLDSLPPIAVNVFTGVSNVAVFAEIPAGSSVLDLGCGGGLDAIIASGKTGEQGRIIGTDFSQAMLEKAELAKNQMNIKNIEFRLSEIEQTNIESESIDIVLANGIFNLNENREDLFEEIYRVLRKGGQFFGAELILKTNFWSDLFSKQRNEKTEIDLKKWFS